MPSGDPTSSSSADTLLDVNVLKEIAKKDLIDALNSVSRKYTAKLVDIGTILTYPNQVNGAKTLVLDAQLAGPLGLVTEVSLLKVCPFSFVGA